MNRTPIFAAALATLSFSAPQALAADGQVDFNGELTSQTCEVIVEGTASPAIATVTLPTVSTASLTQAGESAGRTGFGMKLENCQGTAATAAAFFEAGSTVEPASGHLRNTASVGGATMVELRLIDPVNNATIQAGNSNQRTLTSRNVIANGEADMRYAVEYVATGATTPGKVESSVTFSIDYQ